MKKFRVLNLYACLGGNRYKWDEVAEEAGIDLEVTAIELDPELAKLYQERFPNDTVVVSDAHEYLLNHFDDFDFVWSSPPCPSHSRMNAMIFKDTGKPRYPEMSLYQEIIILKQWFKGLFCVENVVPYYVPLIPASKRGRHLYWSNFSLPTILSERSWKSKDDLSELCNFHDYDFRKYKGEQRVLKIARNLVDYEAGRTIFQTALGIVRKKDVTQTELF